MTLQSEDKIVSDLDERRENRVIYQYESFPSYAMAIAYYSSSGLQRNNIYNNQVRSANIVARPEMEPQESHQENVQRSSWSCSII
jgi:hypothetical protein